ncbi:MAG: hypothetical protein JW776_12895 [Candidatus Lokiarchaeota archaeon]|nr:hypothetical protein [Candidatus Lokiarchaeota archaeon]
MATWVEMGDLSKMHLILTCIFMIGLFILILLIDYFKFQKKKGLIWTFIGILIVIGGTVLGLSLVEPIILLIAAEATTRLVIIVLGICTAFIMIISFLTIIILENIQGIPTKKTVYSILFTAIALMGVIFIVTVVLVTWFLPPTSENLHLGSIIGLPALFMLSVGTIVVIFDEPKLVIYHGLTAGGSWILTFMNVISLFSLTLEQMNSYSGWIHATHILFGGIGLISGFLSALFGISGQRKYAKLTGYVTLGCWWTAYFISQFIVGI